MVEATHLKPDHSLKLTAVAPTCTYQVIHRVSKRNPWDVQLRGIIFFQALTKIVFRARVFNFMILWLLCSTCLFKNIFVVSCFSLVPQKKTCAAALKTNVYPENDACRRRYFPFEEGSHGQHALIFTVFLLQTSRVRSSNFQAGGQ